MTIYVVQDQTDVREKLAAYIVERLGPVVQSFATPWELEAALAVAPPEAHDVVVTDLVTPDYWDRSPKEPRRVRIRPDSAEPENTQRALVDVAVDRIENYLQPIFDQHHVRFIVYTRVTELLSPDDPDGVVLDDALAAIGVERDAPIGRSRVFGAGDGELAELAREVAQLVDPTAAASLGSLYIIEDAPNIADRIAESLAGLERSFSEVRRATEIWRVPGTDSRLAPDEPPPSVVVTDLIPPWYWDPKRNPGIDGKRFRPRDRGSYDAVIAAALDVVPRYLAPLIRASVRVIVYSHIPPFARMRGHPEDADRVTAALLDGGIKGDDVIEKVLTPHTIESEMQRVRDRVGAAIRELSAKAEADHA